MKKNRKQNGKQNICMTKYRKLINLFFSLIFVSNTNFENIVDTNVVTGPTGPTVGSITQGSLL